MTDVYFDGKAYVCAADESLLDCLLRQGQTLAHGCRAGVCQSCILQATEGDIPAPAQAPLRPEQRAMNLLLSCQCWPETPLTLSRPTVKDRRISATVLENQPFSARVFRLRLSARTHWQGGQHVNIWLPGLQQTRCYSIANDSNQDPYLELHCHYYPGGYLSPALANLQPGDTLELEPPRGDFYLRREHSGGLLMLTEETGLAPALGVVKTALTEDRERPVTLLCCSHETEHSYQSEHYGRDLLQQLQQAFPQLRYTLLPAAKDKAGDQDQTAPTRSNNDYRLMESAVTGEENIAQRTVYISGSSAFVKAMQRRCFLLGVRHSNMVCETFLDFTAAHRPDNQPQLGG